MGRRATRPELAFERSVERGEGGPIPNPLQQTFDKRAFHQERARRPEVNEDGPIPNPLQQTFDKRALQQDRTRRVEISEDGPIPNPLQQTYDRRFVQKGSGGGVVAVVAVRAGRAQPGQEEGRRAAPARSDADRRGLHRRRCLHAQGRRGRGGPGGGRGKPAGAAAVARGGRGR